MTLSVCLLAGGASTRMGRDKALLEIGGEPLWRRQWRVLREMEPLEIFLCGPERKDWGGCVVLEDARPGCGPLGGLVSALRIAGGTHLVVLAVDLPCMESAFLRRLWKGCAEGRGIIPRCGGRLEPLAAVYSAAALRPLAEQALDSGAYGLQPLCDVMLGEGSLRACDVPESESGLFFNMNTPHHFRELAPCTK